jgi:hypothetical protein
MSVSIGDSIVHGGAPAARHPSGGKAEEDIIAAGTKT